MANNSNVSKVEQPTRIGDFPAAMPDDEQTEPLFEKRAKEQALEQDENTEFSDDEETGMVTAKVNGHFVNPSSTYPGRNKDLQDADMALPTELDLARRAKAAKSQIPARVFAAGLAEEAGAGDEGRPDEENNPDDEE